LRYRRPGADITVSRSSPIRTVPKDHSFSLGSKPPDMPFKHVALNDGSKILQIGFGTWKIPKMTCADQVEQAFEVGFEHIDTAQGELYAAFVVHGLRLTVSLI